MPFSRNLDACTTRDINTTLKAVQKKEMRVECRKLCNATGVFVELTRRRGGTGYNVCTAKGAQCEPRCTGR